MSNALRSRRGFTLIEVGIVVAIICILFGMFFRGIFSDKAEAFSAAESQGFTDISVGEHHWFLVPFRGCGHDAAMFDVTATNPQGKRVHFKVCTGWPFKGATIRY